jgi:hypothetical protein
MVFQHQLLCLELYFFICSLRCYECASKYYIYLVFVFHDEIHLSLIGMTVKKPGERCSLLKESNF